MSVHARLKRKNKKHKKRTEGPRQQWEIWSAFIFGTVDQTRRKGTGDG